MNLADVVIVGCGALGLSTAERLARRGLSVVAVDRVGPGMQTSARAAGQSVIAQTDPGMGALMHRSIGQIAGFAARTGIPLPYHQVGSVKYARSEWAARQLTREVARARAVGATIDMVSLAEAGRLAPHTDPRAAVAAWHAPYDLYFSPVDLAAAVHRAAGDAGVTFRFGVSVRELAHSRGRVTGVRTGDGDIAAGAVIVAAGSWTEALLRTAGLGPLPLVYLRHQYSIREGLSVHPGLPSVRVVDHAIYARPEGTRLMFGTYEPSPLLMGRESLPDRTEDVPLEAAPIERAVGHVSDLFLGLAGSRAVELRGGVVSMTPDGSYLIDQPAAISGLYYLTGCNVMGLSVSPAIGADMAEWVVTGRRPASLERFQAGRFADLEPTSAAVRAAGLARYESIYRDDESPEHVPER
jgi:glycine/D-amino acid oxidase-like deaminating enzyme